MRSAVRTIAAAALALAVVPPAHAQPRLFESHSARAAGGRMDISVREIERRPRASVLAIEIREVGSSVGASFFLLCSVRKLAKQRGGSNYVVKLEEVPARGQMLVGFLKSADESPALTDPAFAAAAGKAQVIELEQFGAICDPMM